MPVVNTNKEQVAEILTRAVVEILPTKKDLEHKLLSGEVLRIYYGIDPTSPTLHLGNAIILRKLQKLATLGHQVFLVIGSFTAMIGDPSDKESSRPMLSKAEVAENFKHYQESASKIVDFARVEVVYNGDWWFNKSAQDLLALAAKITLPQLIERDLFQKRLASKKDLFIHELLYPLLQGGDSVELDVDLELGGTDQTFNMLMGRKLQKSFAQRDKCVLTVPLIPGTDGRKMSKSYGNVINIDDNPNDMYGKIMSVQDELIPLYLETCTDLPMSRVEESKAELTMGKTNPLTLKKELAEAIVCLYHGHSLATNAEQEFKKVVQEGQAPSEIEEVNYTLAGEQKSIKLEVFVTGIVKTKSKSEIKRLIQQGGLEVDGEKVTDPNREITPTNGMVLKVGKRDFYKIVI